MTSSRCDTNGISHSLMTNLLYCKTPRGIRGYELIGGPDFTVWKLAGAFGGEDYPDKVRGPYNEGGLWAERTGTCQAFLAQGSR